MTVLHFQWPLSTFGMTKFSLFWIFKNFGPIAGARYWTVYNFSLVWNGINVFAIFVRLIFFWQFQKIGCVHEIVQKNLIIFLKQLEKEKHFFDIVNNGRLRNKIKIRIWLTTRTVRLYIVNQKVSRECGILYRMGCLRPTL